MRLKLAFVAPATAALAGLALCSVLVLRTSQALFSATTATPAESWATGSVVITDDDGGIALFDTATDGNLTGGQSLQRCITITYNGTLTTNAQVFLYGTATGTLLPYLNLAVDRGSGASSASCVGFTLIPTAVYSGRFSDFPASTFETGLGPWLPGSTGASIVYRFAITVQSVAVAQSKTATGAFTWEARA